MVAECRLEKSYRRFFKENICYIRLFYQRKKFFFNFLYNKNIEKKNKSLQRSTPETSKQPHKRRLIVLKVENFVFKIKQSSEIVCANPTDSYDDPTLSHIQV